MNEIKERGPIGCGVNAVPLLNYTGAFFTHDMQPLFNMVDHEVAVVGWGVDENGVKYWDMRNSWGEYWGEMGWARIERGQDTLKLESSCDWAVGGYSTTNFPCGEDGSFLSASARAPRDGLEPRHRAPLPRRRQAAARRALREGPRSPRTRTRATSRCAVRGARNWTRPRGSRSTARARGEPRRRGGRRAAVDVRVRPTTRRCTRWEASSARRTRSQARTPRREPSSPPRSPRRGCASGCCSTSRSSTSAARRASRRSPLFAAGARARLRRARGSRSASHWHTARGCAGVFDPRRARSRTAA